MKYLKLYEQFRLLESSTWSDKGTLDIDGKNYKINWGMPKLELTEIFQTLNHHKSSLPGEWLDSFGEIFNSKLPVEFSNQTDPTKEFITKSLEASMKGKATETNPEIIYSSYDLLQLDSIGGKKGDELIPYQNFIKEIHKAFWGGKSVQLSKDDVDTLAKNKKSEEGEGDSGFQKVIEDENFIDSLKIYYDIYIKTEDNPNGILDYSALGKNGGMKTIQDALPNMKEPSNPEHKELWKKYRVSDENLEKNSDAYWEFAKEIYNKANNYDGYFGKSFKYFEECVVSEKEVPLSAAIKIGDKLYLTGGNRRMTFWCGKKILPTIWIWS